MTLDGEQARALAQRSAEARRTLTLADMEAALGALETPADARRWAKQAALWGAKGLIVNAQAFVGFMREWRENFQLDLDRAAMVRLERRVRELEAGTVIPKLERRVAELEAEVAALRAAA